MIAQTAWGGVLPIYLFLGGLGGSTLFIAALLDFVNVKRYRRTVRISAWSSVAFLVAGAVLLVVDVRVPLRALLLWQSFTNFQSWLTIGAWTLLVAIVCAGVFAAAACVSQEGFALRRVVAALCLPLGFATAAYTGVLLMEATAVPAWGTVLLPILFTASAFGSGIAYTMVVFRLFSTPKLACRTAGWNAAALVAALLEAMSLGSYAVWLAVFSERTLPSVQLLLGEHVALFWGLAVLCGIVVPFAHAVFGLALRSDPKLVAVLSALCAFAGGLALRYLILSIGMYAPLVLI
ncbi:MAG: polysulfide reductase NrfD [Eggerthellaceae bacterium]|nr:polysulfide reductase NrfD [Eggerthellaceae bacterium]